MPKHPPDDLLHTLQVEPVLQRALKSGLLATDSPALLFHDLAHVRARLDELRAAFPRNAEHAVAIKANPLLGLLRPIVAAGHGLEAASFEEASLALAAGCPPGKIVFDSPVKTSAEIEAALNAGMTLNIDNLQELARVQEVRRRTAKSRRIGLRVNPEIGRGRIGATSVGVEGAKFGLSIRDDRRAVVEAFVAHPWLNGVHVHTGSQGYDLAALARGVQRGFELVRELQDRLGRERIEYFDIGGGLPVRYRDEDPSPRFADYAAALRGAVPDSFTDAAPIILTELGRAIHAGAGWAVSRVEYTKEAGGKRLAFIHLGADFLVRPVYRPEDWSHRVVALGPDGTPKEARRRSRWTIAGPLCFSGDIVARDVLLPQLEPGDLLVLRDVGAYTLALWSRHCSRAIPAVIGYDAAAPRALHVLRGREQPGDLVSFWST